MNDEYIFTPKQAEGRNKPLLCDKECHGEFLLDYAHNYKKNEKEINLSWLIKAYNQLKDNEKFFNNFFIKLAGTDELRKQIELGLSEDEIRASWKDDLDNYKKIRAKYLLYKD